MQSRSIRRSVAHRLRDPLNAGRACKSHLLVAHRVGRAQIAREEVVRQAVEVVRVEMGDEQRLDRAERDTQLKQPNREAPSRINTSRVPPASTRIEGPNGQAAVAGCRSRATSRR